MGLEVSGNTITITDSLNNVKFTSNDKLIYQSHIYSGNVTLNSSTNTVSIPTAVFNFEENQFFNLLGTINTCSGNLGSQLVGSQVDLSFPLLLHFIHSTTAVRIPNQEILTTSYVKGPTMSPQNQIKFNFWNYRDNYPAQGVDGGDPINPSSSVSISYVLRVFTWR